MSVWEAENLMMASVKIKEIYYPMHMNKIWYNTILKVAETATGRILKDKSGMGLLQYEFKEEFTTLAFYHLFSPLFITCSYLVVFIRLFLYQIYMKLNNKNLRFCIYILVLV